MTSTWREAFTWPKIRRWAYKQSLPIGFVLAITFSMLWPAPGEAVAHYVVNGWKVATTVNMAIIFFIFGVTLDSSELATAVKAWRAVLLGLASMLFISPLVGFAAIRLSFNPREFSLGLAVMAAVPTSLSSGVTLVIQGYGNGALALLFTVAGNIAGIVTAPLMVKAVLGSMTDARVDSLDLLVKLGVSILVPVIVGKALRELVPPVRRHICKFKAPLYLVNNLQITLIVWQKVSAAHGVLIEQEAGDVLLAALAAVSLHCLFLALNIVATWMARLPEPERRAAVVMASQKNLPTAATIISYFDPASVGNLGLITVPCIVFYIMQLFIDAFIANTWASKYERAAALEAKYEAQFAALERPAGTGASAAADALAAKTAAKAAGTALSATDASGLLGTTVALDGGGGSGGFDEDAAAAALAPAAAVPPPVPMAAASLGLGHVRAAVAAARLAAATAQRATATAAAAAPAPAPIPAAAALPLRPPERVARLSSGGGGGEGGALLMADVALDDVDPFAAGRAADAAREQQQQDEAQRRQQQQQQPGQQQQQQQQQQQRSSGGARSSSGTGTPGGGGRGRGAWR